MGYVELASMKTALIDRTDIHLTGQERIVLLDMAIAVPAGSVLYEFGWDRLALALGKVPGTKAAERALERLTLSLRNKNVISRTRPGGNGRTAQYKLDLLVTDITLESCPPVLDELPPTSGEVAPHFSGGERDGKRDKEGPPPCPKHPQGWHHDEPCLACKRLRLAAADQPTQSAMVTVQYLSRCLPGTHRLVHDGTCMNCATHPLDIAAERLPSAPAGAPVPA